MKKILINALVILTIICFAACGSSADVEPTPAETTSPVQDANTVADSSIETEPPVEETPEATPEPEPEITTYKASTYKIGSDMPAGEYVLFCDSLMGYLEISSDSSGKLESIIANDNFYYNSIVTVSEGQYFKISGCYAVPIDEAKDLDISGSGMFKVGYHIPAGEYKLQVDENAIMELGYVEVSSGSEHKLTDIITNDNFEGAKYITVSSGQYLKISDCHIVSRPLMPSDIDADVHTFSLLLAKDDYSGYLNGYDTIGGENMWGQLSSAYESDDDIFLAVETDLDKYIESGASDYASFWEYSVAIYDMDAHPFS